MPVISISERTRRVPENKEMKRKTNLTDITLLFSVRADEVVSELDRGSRGGGGSDVRERVHFDDISSNESRELAMDCCARRERFVNSLNTERLGIERKRNRNRADSSQTRLYLGRGGATEMECVPVRVVVRDLSQGSGRRKKAKRGNLSHDLIRSSPYGLAQHPERQQRVGQVI